MNSHPIQTERGETFPLKLKDIVNRDLLLMSESKVSIIKFRCSKFFGVVFETIFVQQSPKHNFQLFKILKAEEGGHMPFSLTQNDTATLPTYTRSIDSNSFDFSGWSCPYCSHSDSNGGSPFVRCGTCKDMVCGSRIRTLDSGARIFTCHNLCGGGGELGKGTIQSYETVASEPMGCLPGPTTKQLTAGRNTLLPAPTQ